MSTKVITGKVRFSYANVWEPKSVNGSDPKYSVSLIIPKNDTKTLGKIKSAIETAKKEGLAKLGGKIPANLKTPLRDGDSDRPMTRPMQTVISSMPTASLNPALWIKTCSLF